MKKKIAVLAAAVMLVSAVPAFAADSQDNQNGGPGYCYNDPDHPGYCGNQPQGDNNGGRHCRGGCWRN